MALSQSDNRTINVLQCNLEMVQRFKSRRYDTKFDIDPMQPFSIQNNHRFSELAIS